MRNFRNWDIYKNAKVITLEVYKLSATLPDTEKYNLRNQLNRASVSIVANIAEGAGRSTEKDLKHFLSMAIGSCFEVEALIDISIELEFLEYEKCIKILTDLTVLEKQINAFISTLKKSISS